IEQYYDLTPTKKSHVRINDELEKLINISIQREHPYQSHISRCAMFPTYRSPDDPDRGVRVACKLPLDPLLPAGAPHVTLLKKTKGAPYRHELLDVPMATRRNVTTWPGQNGFQNYAKPVKGETQMFYPKAPKTLCPNPSLRTRSATLSARTASVLHNLEKARWISSYQLHHTGIVNLNTESLYTCQGAMYQSECLLSHTEKGENKQLAFLCRTRCSSCNQDFSNCSNRLYVAGKNPLEPSQLAPPTAGSDGRNAGTGLFRSQCVLLELQDTFSRTEAHRRLHKSVQSNTLNLQDNHHTGRKHSFYGFNSYYFHN
uniref:Uncharacterized protein n=1 Tax=Electrophorus electricus TaxID=8005 RepID=A0AAY5EM69_ELEEL